MAYDDGQAPRVVGAASTGTHSVLVSLSEPVDDSGLLPSSYVIVQTNVNSEAGSLRVLGAQFRRGDRSQVELTTDSQSELVYTVTVVGVKDLAGHALSRRGVFN